MKITSIIENTSRIGLPVEHGLSLYIEKDDGQTVLFDMGQSSLFARNAEALKLSIADVDIAVISHGHYDHGGGLSTFFNENNRAEVFIHQEAFLPHFSLKDTGLKNIGLDDSLKANPRIRFCNDVTDIGKGMMLFANVTGNSHTPVGNRLLFGPQETQNDSFCHEQNLIVEEGSNMILFAGCAHRGIVNIITQAIALTGKTPTHVFAGMHLVKSGLTEKEEETFIQTLSAELMKHSNTTYFTMHCTGINQYEMLKKSMNTQIEYMACGDSIII